MLLRWTLLSSLLFLVACGQNRVVEVKDFKIFVDTDEPSLHAAIEKLVVRYNQDFGSQILRVVPTEAESNSLIRFQENLREDGNKLGTGQWITTTTLGKAASMEGEIRTTRIEFGLEVAFDQANFLSKVPKMDDDTNPEKQHLYHLFCHEIGHGMQMDHAEDRHNVMYPTIPEKANRDITFKDYFNNIHRFIAQKPKQQSSSSPWSR